MNLIRYLGEICISGTDYRFVTVLAEDEEHATEQVNDMLDSGESLIDVWEIAC